MSDFTNVIEGAISFQTYELDEGVDFINIGDFGVITIPASGWGENGWGDDPWGGEEQIITVDGTETIWTNMDTP